MTSNDSEKSEIFMGVGSWMICSVGMLLFNKLAVSAFPLACTLVSFQLAFTALAMITVCWSSIHIGSSRDLARWCMVVPFFAGMLLTSMLALSGASMTTIVTFRAIAPIIALMVERLYPNPLKVSSGMLGCILFMIIGAVVYAREMPVSDRGAIGWLILNNFFALGDRLLQRLMLAKDQHPVDISKTGVTFLNNSLALIPLLFFAFYRGEFTGLGATVGNLDAMGLCWVGVSCVVSLGISYTGIWAQSLISATSFLVLINANKFFIIFLEAFVMHTKSMTIGQILGATISILAAVAYGKAREAAEVEHKKLENAIETTPLGKAAP